MAVGTTMLRQSGATYLESGKRYMQSWTGVLSGAMLQHQFDISSSYGALVVCSMDCMLVRHEHVFILWYEAVGGALHSRHCVSRPLKV